MSEYSIIYLGPRGDGAPLDEREWCSDDVWEDEGSVKYRLASEYDALAQQLAATRDARDAAQYLADERGQQLAASQAETEEAVRLGKWAAASCIETEARMQATITRLEATITKALDLDYQRRLEIAEAVALLRECNAGFKDFISDPIIKQISAYLAAHDSGSK